jgi:hypothetical protein
MIDALGSISVAQDKTNPSKMIMLRFQVKDILSQLSDSNLGSVIYANSFLAIDDQHCFINITEGVPNLLNWFTNTNHHEHLCQEVNT